MSYTTIRIRCLIAAARVVVKRPIRWDPRYWQHNPRFPNGTPGLAGLVQAAPAGSGPRIIVAQALADGDLVFTIRNVAGGNVAADIWRVVDGKIIEHWDVVPPPPG